MLNSINYIMMQPSLLSFQTTMEEAIEKLQNVASDNMATVAEAVLTFNEIDGNIIEGIMYYITGPVGIVLTIIYFLTAMLQQIDNGKQITLNDISRPMIIFAIGVLAVTNIGPIVSALMSISNAGGKYFIQNLELIISGAGNELSELDSITNETSTEGTSFIGLLVTLSMTAIAALISFIASAIVYVVLLVAKVELVLRFSFSPIGLSRLASDTQKTEAMRYIRKLVASAFYFVGVVAVLYYANHVAYSNMTNIVDSTFAGENPITSAFLTIENGIFTAIIPFSAIGMISIAKNVVNEAFGS